MADHTSIEWTDATWNPITGCSIVSPGCTNCYAMRLAGTRLKHIPSRKGLTTDSKAGPVWTGEVRLNKQWLYQPIEWKKPRRIFVCAHGDLFAENVPDEWILDVFTVMATASHHTFQVLTKRADRMREFVSRPDLLNDIYANWYTFSGGAREVQSWPLHNVWLGVSAEDQRRADERVPELLATPAAIRFVSAEPLLGPIDFNSLRRYNSRGLPWINALHGLVTHGGYLARSPSECSFNIRVQCIPPELPRLDWIIVGGESGKDARPMHPDWVRSIRDQCTRAGTAFFFKQWGAWAPEEAFADATETYKADLAAHRTWRFTGTPMRRRSKSITGRLLDGIEHNAMPQVPA